MIPWLKIGGAVVVAAALGFLGWNYLSMQDRLQAMSEDLGKQAVALEVQTATIEEFKSANEEWLLKMETLVGTVQEMADVSKRASEETRRLNKVFGKHDLEFLLVNKPESIGRITTDATDASNRMLREETARIEDGPDGGDEAPGGGGTTEPEGP